MLDDDDDDDFDLTDEQVAELSKMPDPAPPQVQAEMDEQLDQYEDDLRQALNEKFGL